LVFSSSWVFFFQDVRAQARQIEICETRYEIWKQVGTEQYYRMFDKNDYSRFCVSLYEGGGLPQEVKGTYVNSDLGIQIELLNDWNGYAVNLDEVTQVTMQPDDTERIFTNEQLPFVMTLTIFDIPTAENVAGVIFGKASSNLFEARYQYSDCDISPGSIITINDMKSYKIEAECPDPFISGTAEIISSTFMTDEKAITLLAVWVHKGKQIDTSEFDNALQTLKIEKPIDVSQIITSGDFESVIVPLIPEWIRTNADWWSKGQIDDSSFINAIQYLIKEKIINIPNLPEQASETAEEKIPNWIKNNAGWWADGLISQDDFVNGIKYLVEKGIIQVQT